ncbi:hypothetical protein FB472_2292 [Rhodoglobus vestalii]|uniref:DNA-binding protein n=1 Tax=Rhodoglobus vestalii TaxID=193384 RepID=A0A8H2PYT4_9MICO|nr:hypothetical protein [Rhodoglobus vestalii]TQO20649.1 hypothetical protein FB472_2292 [Rhodoglobus vestalii]
MSNAVYDQRDPAVKLDRAITMHGFDRAEFYEFALRAVEDTQPTAFPSHLAEIIAASGGPSTDEIRELEKDVASGSLVRRRLTSRARIYQLTATDAEIGDRLGISASAVRHRYRKDLLVAHHVGHNRLLPLWQFDGAVVIPAVKAVAQAIPSTASPLAVHNFITNPHPNLVIGGETVSPRDWLFAGGEPQRVIEQLELLGTL